MISAWCNGEPVGALPLTSRAAHYGDGAFTTLRVHAGLPRLWEAHRERLASSCVALHLIPPDLDALTVQVDREAARLDSAVLKIALVPQSGERGYARSWPTPCDAYLFAFAPPTRDPLRHRDGIVLDTVIAASDDVALGIKTLCRLDQVLAAPAVEDGEPLVCDRDGFVLSARSANLFAQFGDVLATPPVGRGVIAGIARSLPLQSPPPGFSVRVQTMHRDALLHADALILSNAVRGFQPVSRLGDRHYARRDAWAALAAAFHARLGVTED